MMMTDPRKDLKQDTILWQLVLACATCYKNMPIHGNLHGFRCAGSQLQLNGKDLSFKLPTEWSEDEKLQIKTKYAIPYIKQYKQIFKFVAEIYPKYLEYLEQQKSTRDYISTDLFTTGYLP